MTNFNFFEVGGAVRDKILGVNSKDVDFSVICSSLDLDTSVVFELLQKHLSKNEFEIFLTTPEFFTIRAKVPKNHPLNSRTNVADFVLARKESKESDGRRPLWVKCGTLFDDLSRRDFTCNAIAIDSEGNYIDPFNGISDIENKILRFVGDPMERIQEDGLRILRAFRFSITKGMEIDKETLKILYSIESSEMVNKISIERIREELLKMFKHDTIKSISTIDHFPIHLKNSIFRKNLSLMPTTKQF